MARKLSPHPRFSRLQHSALPISPRRLEPPQHLVEPSIRWPQVVDRRGAIAALIQTTPHGYEVVWRMINGTQSKDLDRRGPYPTRALAIGWARVGLLLREEAWLAVHSVQRST